MESLPHAQRGFVLHGNLDRNSNGVKEYGNLTQLFVTEEFGTPEWKQISADTWEFYGYRLAVLLPTDPLQAESTWCAAAWPGPGTDPKWPAFCVDVKGSVFQSVEPWSKLSFSPPTLAEIYSGKHFDSPFDPNRWKPAPR
jgi:hypothetical protein